MIKKFFSLGKTSVKRLISWLFYIGFLPVAYLSYSFGSFIYATNMYNKVISEKNNILVTESANNWIVGIIGGIIAFIFYIVLWKIICELLLLIFTYLENRIKQNEINQHKIREL